MNGTRISELLRTRPRASDYWGVYSAPSKVVDKPGLGMAVAKKLAKRAVDRNRIKRMIREMVRVTRADTLNQDIVVKLKKSVGRDTRGRLRRKEKQLLRSQMTGLL